MQRNRQYLYNKSNRIKLQMLQALIVLLVLGILGILVGSLFIRYAPPPKADNVLVGVPEPEENYLWGIAQSSYKYGFGMAANLYQQEDGSINVYFTNPVSNQVKLMLELRETETDKVLYKSGYINPGEYFVSLPSKAGIITKTTPIQIVIYAFEKDSFVSAGTTRIGVDMHPW